jgi:hypothetical protein
MYKTHQFKVSVNDDNYDAFKTASVKISGRQNLVKWASTCFDSSTHERLLSESSRPYMLMHYLFLYVESATTVNRRRSHHSKHIC